MAEHSKLISIITDEHAEGSPEKNEDVEAESPRRTLTTPALKADSPPSNLAAETGIMPAVFVSAEGVDNNEGQDASRTTAETTSVPDAQPSAETGVSSNPKVLIVEDTVELAEVIQATLERLDMVTVVEAHGDRALRRYEELEPDVVLLDIALPDTTGWKILEAIREGQKTGDHQPIIIVITAYGDAANRLVGKLQDVHDYLVKPFTADEVATVVKKALNSNV
jgi:CheY-like chemotaxis protein